MVDATLFTGQPPNSDPVARPEAIIRGGGSVAYFDSDGLFGAFRMVGCRRLRRRTNAKRRQP